MADPLRLNFVQSAARMDQLPDSVVEVAMVGRSNVGKSSLINALSNRRDLARTSKTPGATRLINIYEREPAGSGRWLVDLPGYGFSKASKSEQRRWSGMIETYLIERDTLATTLVLIDGEIGPTKLDLETIEWLDHIECSYRLVATKMDKVRSSKRHRRSEELASRLDVDRSHISWVSSSKRTGIQDLRSVVNHILDR